MSMSGSDVACFIYGLTLDGSWTEDEASRDGWGDWAGLISGPIRPDDVPGHAREEYDALDPETRDELASMAGGIVSVDSQGFKDWDAYDSAEKLAAAWESTREDLEGVEDDDDGPELDVDAMLRSYVETALWSSTDNADESGGEPLDRNYGPDDVHPDTLAEMRADCEAFLKDNASDVASWEAPAGRDGRPEHAAGHDFWLTRNGHGAGFWDGDWEEGAGKRLTEASKPYGSFYLYIGDDGKIHGS